MTLTRLWLDKNDSDTSLLVATPTAFDRRQHGSRSHESKPRRRKSIWRAWLLLSSWFSLRNRQENVWRLLHQRKEIGARKGMHLVWALVVKGQSILSRMMNLVLLCSELKFLELWLYQKRLALVVRALAVKGQSVLLRTWTLRPDNAVEPVHLHRSLSSFLQRLLTPLEY